MKNASLFIISWNAAPVDSIIPKTDNPSTMFQNLFFIRDLVP